MSSFLSISDEIRHPEDDFIKINKLYINELKYNGKELNLQDTIFSTKQINASDKIKTPVLGSPILITNQIINLDDELIIPKYIKTKTSKNLITLNDDNVIINNDLKIYNNLDVGENINTNVLKAEKSYINELTVQKLLFDDSMYIKFTDLNKDMVNRMILDYDSNLKNKTFLTINTGYLSGDFINSEEINVSVKINTKHLFTQSIISDTVNTKQVKTERLETDKLILNNEFLDIKNIKVDTLQVSNLVTNLPRATIDNSSIDFDGHKICFGEFKAVEILEDQLIKFELIKFTDGDIPFTNKLRPTFGQFIDGPFDGKKIDINSIKEILDDGFIIRITEDDIELGEKIRLYGESTLTIKYKNSFLDISRFGEIAQVKCIPIIDDNIKHLIYKKYLEKDKEIVLYTDDKFNSIKKNNEFKIYNKSGENFDYEINIKNKQVIVKVTLDDYYIIRHTSYFYNIN